MVLRSGHSAPLNGVDSMAQLHLHPEAPVPHPCPEWAVPCGGYPTAAKAMEAAQEAAYANGGHLMWSAHDCNNDGRGYMYGWYLAEGTAFDDMHEMPHYWITE